MSFNLSQWLALVEQISPIILLATPLAPIAPFVALGIKTAEQLPGATGAQKLALAKTIVSAGVAATNAQAGHVEVDPALVDSAVSSGIAAVVATANLVQAAKAENATEAAAAIGVTPIAGA